MCKCYYKKKQIVSFSLFVNLVAMRSKRKLWIVITAIVGVWFCVVELFYGRVAVLLFRFSNDLRTSKESTNLLFSPCKIPIFTLAC